MARMLDRVRRFADRLVGVSALLMVWQIIHEVWGPFVLPSPGTTLAALADFIVAAEARTIVLHTAITALGGFVAGGAIGIALGVGAGLSRRLYDAINPSVVAILGVPPIAWVVLALLWFGATGLGAAMTATLTILPLVFAATVQGMRTLDPGLEDMADAFATRGWVRLIDVRLPQLVSHVVPALATAHGIAWKSVVMAEVLGAGAGLGAELSTARANLDLAKAMALVVLVAAIVLVVDGLILDPLRRRVEAWRADTAAPWSGRAPC